MTDRSPAPTLPAGAWSFRPRSRLALRLSGLVTAAIIASTLAVRQLGGAADPQPEGWVLYLGVAVLGGLGVAAALDALVVRPLQQVVEQVRAASARGWTESIRPPRGAAELTELGAALEALRGSVIAQRRELEALNTELEHRVELRTRQLARAQEQLLRAARLAGLGELAAGVAHEVNNPTGVILSRVDYLLSVADDEGLDPDVIDDLQVIAHQARRVARVTGDLLRLGRDDDRQVGPVPLREVLALTCSLLAPQAREAGVSLALAGDAEPVARGDRGQLEQLAFNLARNALDACAEGGAVQLALRPDGFAVIDDGHGIPDALRARIFEPFVTTRPPGQGSGLGLAVAFGVVADHGGRIEVDSSPGRGATFTVTLPAFDASEAA
ncbi:MAG: hypothetical protein H6739_33155 [Alphaproteobacteria bacterium]|nr:hypothetical protein [Alphaproteobacteria bacterium]